MSGFGQLLRETWCLLSGLCDTFDYTKATKEPQNAQRSLSPIILNMKNIKGLRSLRIHSF